MAISSDLGPFCENLGISREYLLEGNTNSLPKLPTAELLVNGLVYELGQFRFEHNIGWRVFEQWMTVLCESFLPTVTFNEGNLKASVERLLKKVKTMKRNKKDWGELLQESYTLPKYRIISNPIKHAVRQDMSYDHAILSSVNKDLATELHHKTEELQGGKN